MERHTPAGLRLGAYASESETPALHFRSLKELAFGIIQALAETPLQRTCGAAGRVAFHSAGVDAPLQEEMGQAGTLSLQRNNALPHGQFL